MATYAHWVQAGRCAVVFDLDLGAIRSTAQKHVATPGYVATAATLATVATKSAQSVATVATVASSHGVKALSEQPESVASVAAVATVASSHGLATHPEAPAYDPGHAHLLALVQAYCDRTGASPQARAQWVQDVEATAPEQRAELYQYLRARLPPAPRPAPAPAALLPTPPAPRVWLHLDQAWRRLDALYLAHHWTCPTCCTAGAGRGERCDTGQRLHDQLAQAVRSA